MIEELLDVKNCPCGREHKLVTREFIIEEDAILKLPALLEKLKLGKSVIAVFDDNTFMAAGKKLCGALPGAHLVILEGKHVLPDETNIAIIEERISFENADVVLGVGGGVICDASRFAAFEKNVPFIAVPTCASVDGFASSSSALSVNGGKVTLPTKAPVGVVCDLTVLAAAPKRYAASGVGDMLAKYIAIADWQAGHLMSGEYYCDFVAKLQLNAVDDIVAHVSDIKKGGIEGTKKLIEGLLLSGIAMQMTQVTRPASSFEHHFSHFLEVVPYKGVDHGALHGEKVGIATVLAAKYYPIFLDALLKTPREKLKNQFDMNTVISYFSRFSQALTDWAVKENTPTITQNMNAAMLYENAEKIRETADIIPSADKLEAILRELDGYYKPSQIGLTPEGAADVFSHCCYIRNRFTMLRIACDFKIYEFGALLI